ncbi:MAG TPA: hypothetical protein VNV38_08475 [Stellaceae bacterium]|jgi:hypothetical protein|nr:hypothetical protein [Stellaceae bacterium]
MATHWSAPEHHIGGEPKRLKFHFIRFLTSPHCRDLLLIAIASVIIFLAIISIGIGLSADGSALATNAPELLIALLGVVAGVAGWAFQAANTRFGVVDLFAAEIATLCRVAAVADFMPNYVRRYYLHGQFPPAPAMSDYMVVFNNNAKDLEILDGDVVRFVTQFYVYMKALRDMLSRGGLPDEQGRNPGAIALIYNAFLAFESARQAVTVLMEEGPERTEYALTAMVCELPAYLLLLAEIRQPDDLRTQRVAARQRRYERLIPEIEADIPNMRRASREIATQIVNLWRDSIDTNGRVALPERLKPHPPE